MSLRGGSVPDVAAGLAAAAVGAAFLWGAGGIETRPGVLGGPAVVPTTASLVLLVLGLGVCAVALTTQGQHAPAPRFTGVALALPLGGLVYAWAIGEIGYLAATLVVAPFAFALFGARNPLVALAAGVSTGAAVWLIFFQAMGVWAPAGRLFDVARALGL